jgi:cyclophilin family peptidyl-prolyl cis-trans isomerase
LNISPRVPSLIVGVICLILPIRGFTSVIQVLGDRATTVALPITVDLSAHYAFARFDTELGRIYVQLYKSKAPLTVQNFLKYASDRDYDDTIIHRSIPGFVLQGGGYHVEGGGLAHIDVDAPVENEFGISNLRGTVAMAKVGGNPDSATSEWFFNLADNSANLDAQNGGFTVFASVVGDGLALVDQIAAIPTHHINIAGSVFRDLPLEDYTPGSLTVGNLVMIAAVREVGVESYSVSVGDDDLLSVRVRNGSLVVTPTGTKTGQTTVTIQVRTVSGPVVTETSTVHVTSHFPPTVMTEGLASQSAYEGLPFILDLPDGIILDDGPAEDLTYTASLEGGTPLPAWLDFSATQKRFSGTPPPSAFGDELTVKVTATDRQSHSVSTSFALTTIDDADFHASTLELGWNLVCSPFEATEAGVSATVLPDAEGNASVAGSSFAWDPDSATYSSVSSPFRARQGLWLLGPGTLAWRKPIPYVDPTETGDLELVGGWNLVGVTQDLELATLDATALGMLIFWVWEGAGQHFVRLKEGDTLRRGQGCWIGLFGADSYTLSLP